jgi:hypothetical protein
MAYQSIPEQLTEAETALDNALTDASLLDALGAFGYDEATLQEGQTLLEAAQDAQQTMAAEYSDQYEATDALNEAYEEANATYMQHLQVARVALKEHRGAAEGLKLSGRRKRTIPGWADQARTFYDNALADADVQAALGQFGIASEDLTAAQAQVEAVADANSTQEQAKGDAQDATAARDEAVDALDDWMADFRAIARVALEAQPQQLEKLGITSPSA